MTDGAQKRWVFGRDRDPGVAEELMERNKDGSRKMNPMLFVYGVTLGKTCKRCVHLYKVANVAGHYLKCELRARTSGPGSDHRAGWPACGKFEEEP